MLAEALSPEQDDIRTAIYNKKEIRKRTPDGAKQPEYFLPDIERCFPKKAKGVVAHVKQNA